ncbi:hypothetical protein DPMN_185721 [Dreissena polymorpha]|uniref:Uncharacterized protein n=1 Tax=Dreissena polymorpha TaxID=45954 RepID=A0A9D4DK77_DREPO|nr:hypothetical protein DPMN_185721 [Dreissena polymorpha]
MSAVGIDQNGSVENSVNSPNILNDWNSVAFSYDASGKKLELAVNEVRLEMIGSAKHTLALPGTLRLGGGFDTTMTKYNGSMACLHIQLSQKFGPSDFDNNVDLCNSENTMHQPISIGLYRSILPND